MTKITGDEPAMAIPATVSESLGQTMEPTAYGLTIRQELAARAMQGLLSDTSNQTTAKNIMQQLGLPPETIFEYPKHYMQHISRDAVCAADALIEELNKPRP